MKYLIFFALSDVEKLVCNVFTVIVATSVHYSHYSSIHHTQTFLPSTQSTQDSTYKLFFYKILENKSVTRSNIF